MESRQQRIAAKHIIHHLIQQGVTTFFVAPGSRSTPLVLAMNEEKQIRSYVHFDERGLGFFALGYAKATRSPVGIIITSGTSIANLFPAVIEASLSCIPLILLTADRPQELRETGANQTIDQVKFFQEYVRWQCDLALTDPALGESFWASLVARAASTSKMPQPGPVHINCAIREPFDCTRENISHECNPVIWEESRVTIKETNILDQWHDLTAQSNQGVILGGPGSYDPQPILALSDALQWPIFADILSPLRRKKHMQCIHHFAFLLHETNDIQCDFILHVGGRMVSKSLFAWTKRQALKAYCHISPYAMWENPEHLVTHRLCIHPEDFAMEYLEKYKPCKKIKPTPWKEMDVRIHTLLTEIFAQQQRYAEAAIVFSLQHISTPLFLGNSMPIRHADHFLRPNDVVFANRGASGIDGNIATAIGIAEGLQRPMIACMGDQAVLHDLNSLALLKTVKTPLTLIIIDNCGGHIFSHLPIQKRQDVLETFFTHPHKISFPEVAKAFDLPYFSPQIGEDLLPLFSDDSSRIICIQTEGAHVSQEYRHIQECLQAAMTWR